MHAAAVLVAAGRSTRMAGAGGDRKPFLTLADSTVLERAAQALAEVRGVERLVVVALPEDAERAEAAARSVARRASLADGAAVVAGGAERADSVLAGVRAAGDTCGWVLVHDAARPLVRTETCQRALAAAVEHGAALVALPCSDSVHRADDRSRGCEVVDRSRLWLAQTPQVFERGRLLALLERAAAERWSPTDEAALWERWVGPVPLVEGARDNLKITTAADLALATAWLAAREEEPS